MQDFSCRTVPAVPTKALAPRPPARRASHTGLGYPTPVVVLRRDLPRLTPAASRGCSGARAAALARRSPALPVGESRQRRRPRMPSTVTPLGALHGGALLGRAGRGRRKAALAGPRSGDSLGRGEGRDAEELCVRVLLADGLEVVRLCLAEGGVHLGDAAGEVLGAVA